jgi:molybdate transport system substrate-binding protein
MGGVRRTTAAAVVVLAAALVATSACGRESNTSARKTASTSATKPVTIDVFGASSLTEAFTELGRMFESSRRGVTVRFNFGASSALAQQVNDGAPADVFASADATTMAKVVDAGHAKGAPSVFARNRLSIVVAAGNPKAITGLVDLAKPGMVVVLCAPEVPCGSLAKGALSKAGVTVQPKSLEANVKAVVTKVALGEADAGIVYETDVMAGGGKVAGVAVDGADDPARQAAYAIVQVAGTAHPDEARQWVDYVTSSPEARSVLAAFGFRSP